MNALRRQVEEMVEQKGEFVAMPQPGPRPVRLIRGLKGGRPACGATAVS